MSDYTITTENGLTVEAPTRLEAIQMYHAVAETPQERVESIVCEAIEEEADAINRTQKEFARRERQRRGR